MHVPDARDGSGPQSPTKASKKYLRVADTGLLAVSTYAMLDHKPGIHARIHFLMTSPLYAIKMAWDGVLNMKFEFWGSECLHGAFDALGWSTGRENRHYLTLDG